MAIDGSTAKVPRTEDCADHFRTWNPAKGEAYPLARISTLFDAVNGIVVDALIRPIALILSRQAHFCTRLKSSWKEIRKFSDSEKKEAVITLPLSLASAMWTENARI